MISGLFKAKHTPLEVGHVAMVRRLARLRLGITAQDETAAAAPVPGGGMGFGGPQAEKVDAGIAAARATAENHA